MPTVLRIDGLRFVIYLNDHAPAHVHVIGPGWVVQIDLLTDTVREAIGCNEQTARRVQQLAGANRVTLLRAWESYHG